MSEPTAMQPAIAHQNGRGSGYISGQRHLRFLLFSDKDPSSLTLRIAVGTPQQLDWTSYSDKLADPIYPMPPSSDNLKEPHKKSTFQCGVVANGEMDDSLSLAASDAEELSGSVTDPALLPPSS